MAAQAKDGDNPAALLSPVALLRDLPEQGLVRGQVGTIVERLDETTSLVEFSDDRRRAYAIVHRPPSGGDGRLWISLKIGRN